MLEQLILASQSVQALGNLLKSASTLSNYNEIIAAVSDVNSKLMAANTVALTAQEKQADLAKRLEESERSLALMRDWSRMAETYELFEVARGAFAYLPKIRNGSIVSTEKLCPTCFDQGIRSVFQQSHIEVGRQIGLTCFRCPAKLVFRCYIDGSVR